MTGYAVGGIWDVLLFYVAGITGLFLVAAVVISVEPHTLNSGPHRPTGLALVHTFGTAPRTTQSREE